MNVIIAGGGIGGLTLALCLHRAGIQATVYEQATGIRALGVGINILPHAIRQLADLGLLERLDAISVRTEELIYKTARGQDILRQPRGISAGYDVPQFSIHRGWLQKLLHDAVIRELGPEAVRMNRRLVSFSQNDDGVSAVFQTQDGQQEEVRGDVLIGADGIHSTVRKTWHPDESPPNWNGILMWRGATWTKPFLSGRSMIIAGGMKAKLVLYPIGNNSDHPGQTLMNWVICAKIGDETTPMPHREDWSKPGQLSDVMPHVEGVLHVDEVDIPALIAATEEFFVYPMCDRDPMKRWTDGRITLLGDAAHPMYPVGSNGASQAILDAVSLTRHLSAEGAAGLASYEAERLPATAEIVRSNRKGGPEGVIDFVEERAPDGFSNLDDVATPDELRAIVGDYQKMAGFDQTQVNRS